MNAEVAQSLARIEDATGRLLATVGGLTDAPMREPSLLPGWSRGHVLTHIARNADGLANLLRWARTGTETPMYASRRARSSDIEAGAGRTAAELAADLRESAAGFGAQATSLPDDSWTVQVRALNGPAFPAHGVLQRRWSEVEIHYVDLAAGVPAWRLAGGVHRQRPAPGRQLVHRPGRRPGLPGLGGRCAERLAHRPGPAGPPAADRARAACGIAGLAARPGQRRRAAGVRRRRPRSGPAAMAIAAGRQDRDRAPSGGRARPRKNEYRRAADHQPS